MANLDEASKVVSEQAIAPASITATTNGNSHQVSTTAARLAAGALWFDILVGAVSAADATNFFTFSVQKDDNTGFSSPTTVPASDIIVSEDQAGVAWDRLINATGEADNNYKIGIRLRDPDNDFYRLVVTETLTASAIIGASAVLAALDRRPAV